MSGEAVPFFIENDPTDAAVAGAIESDYHQPEVQEHTDGQEHPWVRRATMGAMAGLLALSAGCIDIDSPKANRTVTAGPSPTFFPDTHSKHDELRDREALEYLQWDVEDAAEPVAEQILGTLDGRSRSVSRDGAVSTREWRPDKVYGSRLIVERLVENGGGKGEDTGRGVKLVFMTRISDADATDEAIIDDPSTRVVTMSFHNYSAAIPAAQRGDVEVHFPSSDTSQYPDSITTTNAPLNNGESGPLLKDLTTGQKVANRIAAFKDVWESLPS